MDLLKKFSGEEKKKLSEVIEKVKLIDKNNLTKEDFDLIDEMVSYIDIYRDRVDWYDTKVPKK